MHFGRAALITPLASVLVFAQESPFSCGMHTPMMCGELLGMGSGDLLNLVRAMVREGELALTL